MILYTHCVRIKILLLLLLLRLGYIRFTGTTTLLYVLSGGRRNTSSSVYYIILYRYARRAQKSFGASAGEESVSSSSWIIYTYLYTYIYLYIYDMCVREIMYIIYIWTIRAGFLGWPGARITNATPYAASSGPVRRIPRPYRSVGHYRRSTT